MAGAARDDGRRRSPWRIAPWAVAALLLVLPLVAMQFTDGVDWDETDFIVMAALLFGSCGIFEVAARMTGNTAYLAAVGVAVAGTFLLIWINLAVGIIGSEDNPANLMYGAVLAIGIAGAAFARGRPCGMVRVLVTMALVQVLIAAITLVAGWGSEGENWPRVIVVLNGFFAVLWLVSAVLFGKAESGTGLVMPRQPNDLN